MAGAPDYELHVPRALRRPVLVGVGSFAMVGLAYLVLRSTPLLVWLVGGVSLVAGGAYVGLAVTLRRYTDLSRRLDARDRLLESIPWTGSETVLDVGCGNGILTMAAARRLVTGRAVGIDIWTENAGDSHPAAFRENARIEGVDDRVSLQNEDVRRLPHADESFEVVLSGLTMHHLAHGGDAPVALREMARVTKVGGWIGVYDLPVAVASTARSMRRLGLHVEERQWDLVVARKAEPINPTGGATHAR